MTQGSYSLMVAVRSETRIEVGALGTIAFTDPFYIYTGSAFGPGGFTRIERHRDGFEDGHEDPHWHIDYLADSDPARLIAVARTPGEDIECQVANRLTGRPVEKFGCSDCSCRSHLFGYSEKNQALEELEDLHSKVDTVA